jgi:hypothetical protein
VGAVRSRAGNILGHHVEVGNDGRFSLRACHPEETFASPAVLTKRTQFTTERARLWRCPRRRRTRQVAPWPHSDLHNAVAMSFCQTMLTNAIWVKTWISPRPIAASSSSRLRSWISVSSRSSDRGTAVWRQPVARNMWDTAPPWFALTVKPPKYVHSSDS